MLLSRFCILLLNSEVIIIWSEYANNIMGAYNITLPLKRTYTSKFGHIYSKNRQNMPFA